MECGSQVSPNEGYFCPMFRCELQVPARLLPDAQAVARTVAEQCAGEIMPRQTLVPPNHTTILAAAHTGRNPRPPTWWPAGDKPAARAAKPGGELLAPDVALVVVVGHEHDFGEVLQPRPETATVRDVAEGAGVTGDAKTPSGWMGGVSKADRHSGSYAKRFDYVRLNS